jgi:chemotaxis protein methyltransferase CheR
MSLTAARPELERFRSAIVEQTGLLFEDSKLTFLDEVLERRTARLACSKTSYISTLEDKPASVELAALAQELTVAETYFFRHNDQFLALAEVALPECMRAREAVRTLRLLSAGCASGEEAYSLAIVAQQTVPDASWHVLIRAVDLNPTVLQKATQARYSAWALREAPPDVKARWFRPDRRELVLDDKVRGAVQFEQGNIASDDPALWPAATYDVIFCRNVLMYFSPEQMRAAIARLAASLAPGGYLFLGHAETLRGISEDFHLCHTHDAFYYRRKERLSPIQLPKERVEIGRVASLVPRVVTAPASTAWIGAIQQASERVAMLVSANDKEAQTQRSNGWQLAPALDLLRHERFGEALDYVCNGPPETGGDPDVLLVKAVLLAQDGQLAAAEEACQRLLLIDGLSAGAYYVLALCREHAGDRERAMEHDRYAAHLDPAFAMPRLHCGLLARHAGDRDGARRELAQALLLLKREDVSRLLLFGGGFSRDALIALCQSAMTECGGRP